MAEGSEGKAAAGREERREGVWVALEEVEACWERVRRAGPSIDGTGGGRMAEMLPDREELAIAPPREESLFPPRLDKLA